MIHKGPPHSKSGSQGPEINLPVPEVDPAGITGQGNVSIGSGLRGGDVGDLVGPVLAFFFCCCIWEQCWD